MENAFKQFEYSNVTSFFSFFFFHDLTGLRFRSTRETVIFFLSLRTKCRLKYLFCVSRRGNYFYNGTCTRRWYLIRSSMLF